MQKLFSFFNNSEVDKPQSKKLLQTLYKRNAELGVRNKTLSLLSELYEISITTISSKELTERICKKIQGEFEFELVGILLHQKDNYALKPIAYAQSERLETITTKNAIKLSDYTLSLRKLPFLRGIVESKKMNHSNSLNDIWGEYITREAEHQLRTDGHVISNIIYPLQADSEVIGVAIFGFNRQYSDLVSYELESIKSFMSIIAIALKKALLDEQLMVANKKLKELDKMKSEFVSIASHQLRSPLTSIRGYSSMILEGTFGKVPKKVQDATERIAESSRNMALSIEDYLNVSRIESGNMKYNYSDFNLKDEVEKITDDLRPVALKSGLILLFKSALTTQGVVHADIGKTVQIIHNLLNNSIKYTPKGFIKVLARDDIKNKTIYIDVTDTGIGMNTETQQAIFQKFERAKDANKTNVSGTGLGLFVALKMAEAMGGTITATSEGSDKGSTFTLELPLAM